MKRDPKLDFLLTMALDIHEKDLVCPCGCGFYRADAHDPESDGWYEVDDSVICFARAAKTEYEKEDAKDAEAGTLTMVVDARVTEAASQHLEGESRRAPVEAQFKDEALG